MSEVLNATTREETKLFDEKLETRTELNQIDFEKLPNVKRSYVTPPTWQLVLQLKLADL